MDDQPFDLGPVDQDLALQPVIGKRPERRVIISGKLPPQETGCGRRDERPGHRPIEPLSLDPPPLLRQPHMPPARHRHGNEKQDHQADQPDDEPPIECQAIAPAPASTSLRRSAFSTVSTMCGALRPGLVILLGRRFLVLEHVGQAHRAKLEAGVDQPLVAGQSQHVRAEAADRRFLDRHRHLVRGQQPADQLLVERLGEAQVGDGGRQALGLEHVGGLLRLFQPGAERQDRNLLALADDAALADLQRLRDLGQRHAAPVAARIADRDRPAVVQRHGMDHVHQLGLVGGRHHDEIGQGAEIGEVEAAGVGAAVGADQPGAVHREAHRQVLDRDVVHHLVVGALQEGRVDRAERPMPCAARPAGEGHGMLLGDADVEGPVGKDRLDLVQPGARRHRRGDGDDLLVARHFRLQRLGEHRGVGRRAAARALVLLARDDVELDHAMIFVGGSFRPGHSPCPSWSRHGPASALPRRRGHSRGSRPAPRHYARRPGRHNRSPAPRTASRRSPSRGYIPPSCARRGEAARASPAPASGRAAAAPDICARTPAAPGCCEATPTGGAIDMSLSFRMTISRLPASWALFIAS